MGQQQETAAGNTTIQEQAVVISAGEAPLEPRIMWDQHDQMIFMRLKLMHAYNCLNEPNYEKQFDNLVNLTQ